MDRLRPALDSKAMVAHGREMGAPGHEMNIGAAFDQPSAEITPDPARTHDRNAQDALLRPDHSPPDPYCARARGSIRRSDGAQSGGGARPPPEVGRTCS